MKILFFTCLVLLFSNSIRAESTSDELDEVIIEASEYVPVQVEFIGFSLSSLEQKAIKLELETAAPGCEAELTLLPLDNYPNIKSVKFVVIHDYEVYTGGGVGFNEFDAARMAVTDLRKEVGGRDW